ncbi:unnamed protein product, partial [Prorocentrum cordatum]
PFRVRAASPAPGLLDDAARQLRSGIARLSRKEEMLRPGLSQEAARSPTSSAATLRPDERAAARKPAPLRPLLRSFLPLLHLLANRGANSCGAAVRVQAIRREDEGRARRQQLQRCEKREAKVEPDVTSYSAGIEGKASTNGCATISYNAWSSPCEKGSRSGSTRWRCKACGWATISYSAGSDPCEKGGKQWQRTLALRENGCEKGELKLEPDGLGPHPPPGRLRESKQWQPELALREGRRRGWATIRYNAGSNPCEKRSAQWQRTLALCKVRGWATISGNAGSRPCEKEGLREAGSSWSPSVSSS